MGRSGIGCRGWWCCFTYRRFGGDSYGHVWRGSDDEGQLLAVSVLMAGLDSDSDMDGCTCRSGLARGGQLGGTIQEQAAWERASHVPTSMGVSFCAQSGQSGRGYDELLPGAL